jgi:hypothetical protein
VDCYKAAQAEKAKKAAQVSRKRIKAKIRALPPVPLFTDGVGRSKPDKVELEPVGDEDLMEGVEGGGPSGMTSQSSSPGLAVCCRAGRSPGSLLPCPAFSTMQVDKAVI